MNIRKALPEELPQVQELNAELFRYEQHRDPDLKMDWPYKEGAAYFAERISGREGVCFVAEVDGQVVGYSVGAMVEEVEEWRPFKRAEAENMLVKEAYRGQGIGEKLLTELFAWAKEQGAEKIITSIYLGNEGSIRFHERLGFKSCSVEMERDL